MLKKIFLALVVVVVAVLAYAATRPDTLRVERRTSIKAPPEKIYVLIEDFHRWEAWSPWEKVDPGMKRTYSGAEKGLGAIYAWQGDSNVGSGRMEVVEAASPSRVVIKLDFIEPFEGHNTAEFTLNPAGDSTQVTWMMYGPNTYLGKLMSVLFDFDTMIGEQFESGLAQMKSAAEA